MRWLGYVWCVAVNLFYLLVVFAVLIDIKNPTEKATISVLGIVYVAVRSIGIGQALMTIGLASSLQDQIDRIRYAVDNTFEVPDRSEETSSANYLRNKLYITSLFISFISIVCLWQFFTAHS